MKKYLFILAFCMSFQALAQTQFLKQWEEKQHTVQPGETLRLIARKYFGVKFGVFCLQNQLQLDDPNKIVPGQQLDFVSPQNPSDELDQFLSVSLECSKDRVVLNGQEVFSRGSNSNTQESVEPVIKDQSDQEKNSWGPGPWDDEASAPSQEIPSPVASMGEEDLHSLEHLKRWGGVRLQSGVSYFDFNERAFPDEGSTNYKSVNFLDFNFQSRMGVSASFGVELEASSIEGQFIKDIGNGKKEVFRWNQGGIGGVYEIRSLRIHLASGLSNYTLLRAGVLAGTIPFLLRNAVEVRVEKLEYTGGHIGIELNQFLGSKWRLSESLSYLMSFGDWESNFGAQGSLQAHRNFYGSWWLGLSWYGKLINGDFDRVVLGSKVDFNLVAFHSTASASVLRTF
ncbi:MAG: LysM peptidoglycan-binding domain-containing protein [Bdellovibrionales bacterium]|nr:LysM peptidoglycan-binding domain-containing protein [Bdellovibrionales bacterium]